MTYVENITIWTLYGMDVKFYRSNGSQNEYKQVSQASGERLKDALDAMNALPDEVWFETGGDPISTAVELHYTF